jgi:hypothetical protein
MGLGNRAAGKDAWKRNLARSEDTRDRSESRMIAAMSVSAPTPFETTRTARLEVRAATVVFRVVRGQLSVGLPIRRTPDGRAVRVVPTVAPNEGAEGFGLLASSQLAASHAVAARELVRLEHAGVRVVRIAEGAASADTQCLHLVSWAIARPVSSASGVAQSVEAEEVFVPIASLAGDASVDHAARALIGCAFDAFLDATLADALTRRLLPRHVLFRKTDGFSGRSPFEAALAINGTERVTRDGAAGDTPIPIFVGLLPDPFPLSALREFYEHLLGAALDRGNFRRQFQEVISAGPITALPIFERGVPHRAGQLFTFDRAAWERFATKA